jgi:non-ribosomal peptide synthetase component F
MTAVGSVALYSEVSLRRIARLYLRLLGDAVQNTENRISTLKGNLVDREEMLRLSRGPATNLSEDELCLARLFERQVRERGEAIAIRSEEGDLSFGEWYERSQRIAAYLRSAGGETFSLG